MLLRLSLKLHRVYIGEYLYVFLVPEMFEDNLPSPPPKKKGCFFPVAKPTEPAAPEVIDASISEPSGKWSMEGLMVLIPSPE